MKPVLAIIAALGVSGCANAVGDPSWSLLQSNLGGPSQTQLSDRDLQEIGKPTVANKTLSAMALERATGRQPDPARLVNFD